ncbi:hypothetical protein [Corynebacterium pseudodiphtheriticum]|uniref:hypothetical protein n=1 Tax=Corynebacterium pseudodiphtheriticum TaxID=37637 RepID=UPI0025426D6E|nr:hypothetical protein [Corynebacterium pseudodiphtheriticum]MDK4207308.1 hypothetical protein [Corynebacterium pseudodiphtheriticum]
MPGIVDWGNPGSDELGSPADAEVLRATLAAMNWAALLMPKFCGQSAAAVWVRGGSSCPRRVWAGA